MSGEFGCHVCGKRKRGYWKQVNFKRRWTCYECAGLMPQEDHRDRCWRHGLPMREYGGCAQCEVEGF